MRGRVHHTVVTPALAAVDGDLYRRHAVELVRYAASLVGPDDAPDVVADAVLAAFSSPAWRTVTQPRAYLYRAVYHRAIETQRSSANRQRREVAATQMRTPVQSEPTMSVDAFDALKALSPQQRAVVFLTYWEDLTPTAIAELLDVGEGTVRKQLARAREQLRKVLS